tara:strand:+ start:2095 stop:2931 length:837 start_codon:yes stop_codon:yes gene_type:complete
VGKIWKMGVKVDQFVADTVDLSDDEMGKYWRMILYAWKLKTILPNDIKRINQISKNPNLKKTQYLLDRYFIQSDDGYTNKAQLEEWKYIEKLSQTNSENANLRWDNKKEVKSHSDRNTNKSKSKSYIDYNIIIDTWNKYIPSAQIKVFNQTRKQLITKRFNTFFNDSYEEWEKFLVKIAKINFLWGDNDRGWKADFNWVLNENNYIKIFEGKYQKDVKEIGIVIDDDESKAKRWIANLNNLSPFILSLAQRNFQDIQHLYRKKLLTKEQVINLGINIE